MLNFIRSIWALNTHKTTFEGTVLDLTYITDKIIAMSYPGRGMQIFYCQPRDKVEKFLTERHGEHLLIVNASGFTYSSSSLKRIINVPWEDHRPCPLARLLAAVLTIARFLKEHPKNTVAVHCWGGKGRTGVIIAALLLFMGEAKNIEEAKQLFKEKRGVGVTRKGQNRYLAYTEVFYRNATTGMQLQPRRLKAIRVEAPVGHFGQDQFTFLGSKLDNNEKIFAIDFNGRDFTAIMHGGSEMRLPGGSAAHLPHDLTLQLTSTDTWRPISLFNLNLYLPLVADEAMFDEKDFDNCSLIAKQIRVHLEFEALESPPDPQIKEEWSDLVQQLIHLKRDSPSVSEEMVQ